MTHVSDLLSELSRRVLVGGGLGDIHEAELQALMREIERLREIEWRMEGLQK